MVIVENIDKLPDKMDFNFHVKPILSDKCFACHGPDSKNRKANLRLDINENTATKSNEKTLTTPPKNIARSTEGNITSNFSKKGPTVWFNGIINLKKGTDTKPVNIETIAPFSFNPSQKIDIIMTGQKVAAIPDHPKMTNQKTVLVGDKTETARATRSARKAKKNVTLLEIFIRDLSLMSGRIIFW